MIDEKLLMEKIKNVIPLEAVCLVEEAIEEMPKIGEWIPCSERLPKKPIYADEGYIVQQKHVCEPFTLYWDGEK